MVLSYDPNAWHSEHFFAVTKEVPNQEMVKLSGYYLTRVFEGSFKNAKKWLKELSEYVESHNKELVKPYFFYTTCPKCAKIYEKNYVVGIAEVQ